MAGTEDETYDFEVDPATLTAYAQVLERSAADLAATGAALGGVAVERGWFGRLPQAGFVADRYAAHREGELRVIRELGDWLGAAGVGLRESAGRYSGADRVVAEAARGAGSHTAEGCSCGCGERA